MANANTTTTNRNIFTTIGRNTAAIVAAGALALGLSGCDNGNNPNESVKPLPTPSQIDKPTTPTTQEPSTQETTPNGDPCVGSIFLSASGRFSDVKAATDCLNESGREVTQVANIGDIDGDGKSEINIDTKDDEFVLSGTGELKYKQ